MLAALGKIIECPVCLEVPKRIPIYRCDNGHISCKQCKKKLTHCPQCRIRLEGKRCLVSEKIVREFLSTVIILRSTILSSISLCITIAKCSTHTRSTCYQLPTYYQFCFRILKKTFIQVLRMQHLVRTRVIIPVISKETMILIQSRIAQIIYGGELVLVLLPLLVSI